MKARLAMAILLAGLLLPLPNTALGGPPPRSAGSAPMRMRGFARPMGVRPMPAVFRGRPWRPMPAGAFRGMPARVPFRRQSTGYYPGSACFNNPTYSGSFYCSSLFGSAFGRQPPPVVLGGLFAPVYWGAPLDYGSEEEAQQAEVQPVVVERDDALASQVHALTREVELMRGEQELRREPRAYTPPPGSATARPEARVEKPPATTFVYRDGREFEAQNYAILGKTLWVFGETLTRKIPLTDLDLNATEKKNEERGVDFVPPSGG